MDVTHITPSEDPPVIGVKSYNTSRSSRHAVITWGALAFACSLFFAFWNLGHSSYHAEDEALHVSVIQHMIHDGHLVVPHDESGPYFNKPPLKMWATIPIVSALGEIPFSFRFLDALAGLGCGLLIFHIGRSLFSSPRAGLLSTLFFFTADIVLFDHGIRNAVQDSWLLFFSTAAIWIGYRAIISPRKTPTSTSPIIAIGVLTGLSIMVKSAAGLLAPALLVLMWLPRLAHEIRRGNHRRSHWHSSLRTIVITVACAATPPLLYGAIVFVHHPTEFLAALNREVVSRVTDGFQRQDQPFFYLTLIGPRKLAIDGAWLVLSALLMGLFVWKRRFEHGMLLTVWGLGPLLLFSAAKTRLEWYILPAIPAHALIAGWALDVVFARSLRNVFPRRTSPLIRHPQTALALGNLLMLLFGTGVLITELRRSILCILSATPPVALDDTARAIIRETGSQSTVIYPDIRTLVPALFERNLLRSLSGGNPLTASSLNELSALFGTEPGQHPLALTLPEAATHLISTGGVYSYRSLPPLMRLPRQHQRRHWMVLLSAKPMMNDSFQQITTTHTVQPEGGIAPLPPSSFITQTVGMSVIITEQDANIVESPPVVAVRVLRNARSEGAVLSCTTEEKQVRCEIPPELAQRVQPSFLRITRMAPAEKNTPLMATIRIGPQRELDSNSSANSSMTDGT